MNPSYLFQQLPDQDRQYLMSLLTTQKNKSLAFAVCLGRILSKKVKQPSMPVESPILYFGEQLLPLGYVLDGLVEFFPIDVRTIRDVATKFCLANYEMIHGDTVPYTDGGTNGVAQFFRISKHISPEIQKEMDSNLLDLVVMTTKLNNVVELLVKNNSAGAISRPE